MTNLEGGLIGGGESAGLVGDIYLNYADDLGRIYLNVVLTYVVAGLIYGNLAAVRRIGGLVDIVQTLGATGVGCIEFDDELIGQTGYSGSDTDTGGYPDLSVLTYIECLHDADVELTVESVTEFLCHLTQVDIVVSDFTVINGCAEILVCGIRGAIADSVLT